VNGENFVLRRWLCWGRALIALFLALAAAPAQAQKPLSLQESCRIAAPVGTAPARIVEALRRCERPAGKTHVGTTWILYPDIPHMEPGKTWRLAVDNHRVRAVDLFVLYKDGSARRTRHDPADPNREWAAGNYFSMLFTPYREVSGLMLRLEDAQGFSFVRAPKLSRARNFGVFERDLTALYGISVGMLALTILFHLSLFFAIRRRFQLIYCVHVLLLFGYGLCYSGIVRLAFPGLTATGISQSLSFTMAGATATGILFVVEFLGTVTPLWVRRWATGSAIASVLAAFALVLVPPAWGATVFAAANLIAVHAILLTAGILIAAIVRRTPMASALLLGWALPIAVSLMYPARMLGLITPSMLPDGLMMLVTTIECLILSLPVAARIRALRIAHERAQERHIVLERQAQTDALTGLANRRGFGDAIGRMPDGEPTPIAVLVIDIDHFKRVNDRHGHAAGDAILRHVAGHVARVAGPGAIVSRYGGEEFVVALRGHDLMRASTIAERIRASIGLIFETETDLPAVTISIGVAAGYSNDIDTVLKDADCALYRAKDDGRNRVMLADGPLMYSAAA
jgi:two-component system, sensor histidine kinase LadS